MERRLAAIVAGDVVGFSRLMAEDETATYAQLRAVFDDVVAPTVAEHSGRLVKTTGDGFIAAFASANDAVDAALDVQRQMADRPLTFRVGINLGDVIEEDGDVFGDDVNLAVRLQAAAEPGTIRASAAVVRSAEKRNDVHFLSLGKRRLKNIPGRIEVFDVATGPQKARRLLPLRSAAAAAAAIAVAIGIGAFAFAPHRFAELVARPVAAAPPAVAALPVRLDGRPTVAVLPFDNLSGEPAQDFFSDGLTEDVIAALARNRDLSVLARNSTFAFKGRASDIRAVGEALGADYVVEGSARRFGDQLRVVAQLIDSRTGAHLWSRDYDRRIDDVFEVQADLTSRIVASLVSYVRQSETAAAARRPTDDARAYELVLQGRSRFQHGDKSLESMQAARALFQRAVELDPGYASARAFLGLTHIVAYADRFGGEANPTDLDKGIAEAREAVRLAPDLALGYQILSFGLAVQRDFQASLIAAERAVELTPSDPDNLMALAKAQVRFGAYAPAVENAERARRLHPIAPAYYAFVHGQALYASGRTEEAERVLAECMLRAPREPNCQRIRISALTRLGRLDEARDRMAELIGSDPSFSLASERLYQRFGDSPLMRAYLADLSAAGAPERSAQAS